MRDGLSLIIISNKAISLISANSLSRSHQAYDFTFHDQLAEAHSEIECTCDSLVNRNRARKNNGLYNKIRLISKYNGKYFINVKCLH